MTCFCTRHAIAGVKQVNLNLEPYKKQNETIDKAEVTIRGPKSTGVKRANRAAVVSGKTTDSDAAQNGCNFDSMSAKSVANGDNETEVSTGHGDATCPACLLAVDYTIRSIQCNIYMCVFHQRCKSVTAKVYDKFVANVKITGWVCFGCKVIARSSFQQMKQAISRMAEELVDDKL